MAAREALRAQVTILTMTAFYRMGALAMGYNDHPEAASRPFDIKALPVS